MTFQQLKLVLETAECGSISSACEKLNLSQPNASQTIKKLEAELGYSIFRRENGGISPTEQGYLFLEHAKAMLEEEKAIHTINSQDESLRLRVGSMNLSFAIDAFLKFCNENNSSSLADSTCINVSADMGIKCLRERSLDIIVALLSKEMFPLAEKSCKENRLTMNILKKIPICIRLRKKHPLVESGILEDKTEFLKQLKKYPYIEYRHLEHLMSYYDQTTPVPFGCSYKIYVEERDTRLKALANTDAYSIGCELTPKQLKEYGLINVPVGYDGTIVSFVRKGDENLPVIKKYTKILNKP